MLALGAVACLAAASASFSASVRSADALPPASAILAAARRCNDFVLRPPSGPNDKGGMVIAGAMQRDCSWEVATYYLGLTAFYEAMAARAASGGSPVPHCGASPLDERCDRGWTNASVQFVRYWADDNQRFMLCNKSMMAAGRGLARRAGTSGADVNSAAAGSDGARSSVGQWVPPGYHDADRQLCGASYAELYKIGGRRNGTYIAHLASVLDQEVANKTSDVNWSWLDALHMGMNPYARLGNATGDVKYFDKLYAMFTATAAPNGTGSFYRLWNETDALFYRDVRFRGSGEYWARGNGWAIAALVTALRFTEDPAQRVTYLRYFVRHAERLRGLQGSDGAWRSSLLEANKYPDPETTGTSYIVYGIAYGVNAGHLDAATYMPTLVKGWSYLATLALQPSGLLGRCQPVGAAPATGIRANDTNVFCVGMFLSAASELAVTAAAAGGKWA